MTVAGYVFALSKGEAPADGPGQELFSQQCISCHGEDGGGNAMLGGPPLNNRIFLYGGQIVDIAAQVRKPTHGVMPPWENRLSDEEIKQARRLRPFSGWRPVGPRPDCPPGNRAIGQSADRTVGLCAGHAVPVWQPVAPLPLTAPKTRRSGRLRVRSADRPSRLRPALRAAPAQAIKRRRGTIHPPQWADRRNNARATVC